MIPVINVQRHSSGWFTSLFFIPGERDTNENYQLWLIAETFKMTHVDEKAKILMHAHTDTYVVED